MREKKKKRMQERKKERKKERKRESKRERKKERERESKRERKRERKRGLKYIFPNLSFPYRSPVNMQRERSRPSRQSFWCALSPFLLISLHAGILIFFHPSSSLFLFIFSFPLPLFSSFFFCPQRRSNTVQSWGFSIVGGRDHVHGKFKGIFVKDLTPGGE